MSCATGRHQRDSAALILHSFNCPNTVSRRGRSSRRRSLNGSCAGQGHDPGRVARPVFVFLVSQGDVFCGFSLFLDLLPRREGGKRRRKRRLESPEAGSYKIQCKIVFFSGEVVRFPSVLCLHQVPQPWRRRTWDGAMALSAVACRKEQTRPRALTKL